MSKAATYYWRESGIVLSHGNDGAMLLRDQEDVSLQDIKALVASGDCFITLATTIDEVLQTLTVDRPIVGPQLEKLTSILLHLQRHYRIHRQAANYRQ